MIFAIEMVKICWKYFCLYSCFHLVSLWVHAMLKLKIRQGSILSLMYICQMLFFCPYFMFTFHMFHKHGQSLIDYLLLKWVFWLYIVTNFFVWGRNSIKWQFILNWQKNQFEFLVVIFLIFKNHQILSYILICNQKYRKNNNFFFLLYFVIITKSS